MVLVKLHHNQKLLTAYQHFDRYLFYKLRAFLTEQRRRRKANDGLRKLGGAVDKSSADWEIHKSDVTVHNLCKIWRPAPSGTRSYVRQAGWQADEIRASLEILKLCCTVDRNIRFSTLLSQGTALFQ